MIHTLEMTVLIDNVAAEPLAGEWGLSILITADDRSILLDTLRLDSGTLTPLLKRLEKQGLIVRTHPQSKERKLFLSLTEKGAALRERALEVPGQMHGCIDLPTEELMQLKTLLDKALTKMGRTRT